MAQIELAVPLEFTPLHALHLRLGARMVPFAGYDMPVQYPAGIIKEHQHTRTAAGLFDVSHMGLIELRPRSGRFEDAARALETLMPADIVGLAPGRQRYALITNEAGGIVDDLIVSNQGDHLLLIVNASRKEADESHLVTRLAASCEIATLRDRAIVALQGPQAEEALAAFAPSVRALRFMDTRPVELIGERSIVARSGYTGEDGFEIVIPARAAEAFCTGLLEHAAVAPAGLGARDSLRLEAGFCLYGADLDGSTTPVEAALDWSIAKVRRAGGARAGGFPGADTILRQLREGAPRFRVGLKPEGRAPVRAGALLYGGATGGKSIGTVTSGGFGPTIGAPVAMGYVAAAHAREGDTVFADVRGKRLPVEIAGLHFVPAHFKR